MSEVLTTNNEKNELSTDWGQVFARIEQLEIPSDIHERADDVARNFSTGTDIEMFGKALHDVLMPSINSMPADRAITATNRDGEVTKVFKQPEERAQVYQDAANYIGKLAAMRQSPDDDHAFLARSANVIGLSVTIAHTYENGNGRLSRVMAELVREGVENKEDLLILGTERDVSVKMLNGKRIYSFQQMPQSRDRGENDEDAQSIAASTNIPLNNPGGYENIAGATFTSPIGY